MKNFFTLLTFGLMVLFVSCDNGNEMGSMKHLKFTSDTTFDVGANGDTVAATYQIYNPIEGLTPVANVVDGKEAISSITHPATGVMLIAVAPNTTDQKRVAVIEVVYDVDKVSIIINQEAGTASSGDYDVEFKAYHLNGHYLGQKYGEGSDRYLLYFSENGMNNMGQAFPNSKYYYIDAFGPVATSGAPYTLADGVYNFDTNNSGNPFTFTAENSQLLESTDTDVIYTPITAGKMVVSNNTVTLDVTIDGKVHHVTYFGSLELEDNTEENGGGNDNPGGDNPTGGQEKEAQSTLTADRNVTFEGEHRAFWEYAGDWWKVGYSNYTVMIMNKYNGYVVGDTLQLDIITDDTGKDGDIYGTYTISYTPGKNVAMAGFTDTGARPVGTWLFEYGGGAGGGYKNYAMIIKGSLTIKDNGNGTATVILDSYDCKNNHITCNWTGVIEKN